MAFAIRPTSRRFPGKPDIAFTRARIAVFVDGCFWHRCPDHGTAPKNNGKWWPTNSTRTSPGIEEMTMTRVKIGLDYCARLGA